MKFCSNCGTQLPDEAKVCTNCGTPLATPYAQPVQPMVNEFDHTAEFDPKDISDNKVIAMLPYLLGAIGLIIAILLARTSKYVAFHVRTALKYMVVNVLLGIVTVVLCWTIIVPIAGAICMCIVSVLQIISFFQVCMGKAKDPAIIRSLGFLK